MKWPSKLNRLAPLIVATACTPSVVQVARPLPSQAPLPTSSCEHDNTFELAASVHDDELLGFAVYRRGSEDPEALDALWARMNEPTLQVGHQARIQLVDEANARVVYWSLGGLGVMAAGIGTAAALQDATPTGAAVAGITGLVLGLAATIVAVVVEPSDADQMAAEARRYMFIPGEDDEALVLRGVTKLTTRARQECR